MEVLKLLKSSNRRSISERGDIKLLLLTGIIIPPLPSKTSMSSNCVLLILYVTTLWESLPLLTTFRKMDSLA